MIADLRRRNKVKIRFSLVLIVAMVTVISVVGLSMAAGAAALTEEEKAALLYMREEEKLAFDVYKVLASKWNVNIFTNISESEQKHIDSVALTMEKYGLADPVKNSKPGVFINVKLQNLYNQLVAEGSTSLQAAFKVGMTIEDVDIFDLQEYLKFVKNEDVVRVFENLKAGSINHMQAFYSQLKALGGEYVPQFIKVEEFKSIVGIK